MKKQSVLLMLLAVLFTASVTTSCSKSKDKPKDDEEQPGGGNNNPNLSKYLKGSDYYLISLDETSKKNIESKVKKDYRTDDVNTHLYVWDNTYVGGSASGPNAFGEVEGWISLVVNNPDWSGCGFANDGSIDFTGLTNDHVLHFAMKSKDQSSHQILLYDKNNSAAAKFTIGAAGNAIDGINPSNNLTVDGVANQSNFARDGEWHHIEIPLSTIKLQGVKYNSAITSDNMLAILSGGGIGKTLDIDGIFFYKPAK